MFGFPRLKELVGEPVSGDALIDRVLADLASFTGPGWEQEDDITLVTLSRASRPTAGGDRMPTGWNAEVLAELELPSEPGGERAVLTVLADAVEPLGLRPARRDALATAVAEATMNAIEHGNDNRRELPVRVVVAATDRDVRVSVSDHAVRGPDPGVAEEPDIVAKLAGEQSPRGWGLFLMRNLVDEVRAADHEGGHTVELVLHRDGPA
jgi:anti-sigma regulatory factor (Ser/Thr protein kinase)